MVKLYLNKKNTKKNKKTKTKSKTKSKTKLKTKTKTKKNNKIKGKPIKHNHYTKKTKKINNYTIKKIIKGGSICNLLKVENNSSVGLKNISKDVLQNLLKIQTQVDKLTPILESNINDYNKNTDLANLIKILITTNNFETETNDTVVNGSSISLYNLNKQYGAIQIQTSGNLNDCLIHSILTCVSEDFRKLKKNDKDIIASAFRRIILPSIDGMSEPNKHLLKSNNFLDDRIIESINAFYNIKIIAINENYNKDLNFINLYLVDTYIPTIFLIHNSNNIHFTAIKFKNDYNVTEEIFNYLNTKKDEVLNKNKTIKVLNKEVLDGVLNYLQFTKIDDYTYKNKDNKTYTIAEAEQYILEHGYDLNYP